jgi:hypothetical protein
MLARLARLATVPALSLAAVAALALPGAARAADRRVPELRPGIYDGIWHTDAVNIIVEEVGRDGGFRGGPLHRVVPLARLLLQLQRPGRAGRSP